MTEGETAGAPVPLARGRRAAGAAWRRAVPAALACASLVVVAGCGSSAPDAAGHAGPARERLVFLSWADDLPPSVIEAFEAEFGVELIYESYESTEEAVERLRAGREYDIAVIDGPYVPGLAADGLLAEIDYRKVPNFRHVSANFRDLAFDPGNRHSVTYNWGLAGLIVRTDLVDRPVLAWQDLWDPAFAGRVLAWDDRDILIGITLRSLGYSINTDSPEQLEQALQKLLQLRASAMTSGYSPDIAMEALASGEAVLMFGWSADALRAREEGLEVAFVLPEEGSIQWIDNFVIPASSGRKALAEAFIDFMLRPEISAQVVNEHYYPTANDSAYPYILPEILGDPLIVPPASKVANAEVHAPASSRTRELHEQIWSAYLAAGQQAGAGP
ncbi:spermidine/putrescine ABC transporter substrate-binding protein [Thioalkalivibrio sp. XN8]|uniref:ABC transporter substrate-binding protein n=1 Tax=Thioalkalivibrio sp. XN8 TaxID=2712863 RepID=UPI0013EDB3D6|nr:spermidine/putrescine ABC transporter substrate-binding protein [Thioalkalivibrio sp. XN8]NGP54642.1 spermidine/putrescine ABC transporter substrate-binding protein [Thioalkalivibrio sp. XN8]